MPMKFASEFLIKGGVASVYLIKGGVAFVYLSKVGVAFVQRKINWWDVAIKR